MSAPLRSKQGCWTCRLRKKKCDEGRPHCSTCESLSITCYGYGPKPEWMDNGERERAVANSLKEIVKHTSRRKATTQFSKQRDPVARIAPKYSNGSVENSYSGPESNHQHGVTPPLDHGPSKEDGANMLQDGSADFSTLKHGDHLIAEPITSADEYVLLMHFLDNVFLLQYPMYKPGILEGGRGWLLALLLRSKPLYHAALALSVHHRRMTILAKISHPCRVANLVKQEKHLEICIKSVNQFTQSACSKSGLGIAIAVVQLVFFELFTGHGNAWQAHLRAGMNMYLQGIKNNLANFGLAEKSTTIIIEDLSLLEYDPVVVEEVVSFRFLGGALIWLDITSSITLGTSPYLLPHHFSVLASNSLTKLEDIMGCKNWVMLQIGRITALHEYKAQALQQEYFDCTKFKQTASDISREINHGLTEEALEDINISERDLTTIFNTASDSHTPITHIFAYMAFIYLHLVIHGFQRLEELDTTLTGAMRILQTRISKHLLPTLISPLYIIGSVAGPGDKQFFRNIFTSPPLLDPSLKHRESILPILEEIWNRRKSTPGFDWKDSLELTNDILLL